MSRLTRPCVVVEISQSTLDLARLLLGRYERLRVREGQASALAREIVPAVAAYCVGVHDDVVEQHALTCVVRAAMHPETTVVAVPDDSVIVVQNAVVEHLPVALPSRPRVQRHEGLDPSHEPHATMAAICRTRPLRKGGVRIRGAGRLPRRNGPAKRTAPHGRRRAR
eukprot:scaffold16750_cov58-Phaeocystis_antarctica.AAC.3